MNTLPQPLMPIELSKEARKEAIASVQRYYRENMDEPIGNMAAGALIDFLVAEIGPCVYNKAVAEVQQRLHERILELDMVMHEDEFRYWHSQGSGRSRR